MPELQWEKPANDLFTARDGRYLVQLEQAGWVARVYHDSRCIHEFKPTSIDRYAKQHCLAVEVGIRLGDLLSLERTKPHMALPMHEVTEGSPL